ncbi:hypothetical protein BKA69DRAFT_687371 [Paraphysoderma sedebokerense]|nr:hypothetical protein BKA69DRAFT_687371 [Paraphysoderma sedebokerense]
MSAIFVRAIFVFAYTLVCLAAGDVPNPFYPKSIASVALQSTVTDVIEVAKNRTHTLVVDSEFNIHVFESPQGGAVTHTLSMQLSTAARGDVGGTSWSHWRSDNAFALVMHPNLNTVMYAIKYTRLSKPRANIYILNTSVPFNQVEKDGFEYANTLSEFFTIPMRYPRLATNISFNYLYLGVFNDGSRDTSNNASGFWLSMHSIYNPFNSDFFRHIGSKTKRVLSMDFFCHELPVVCLWTSPDTVEEYSMEDLTFRREYTVASRPINFDPRIAMDATTYSSYFFHRDLSNADEFLLQRRNRTELLAVRTFPYQTSFAYDIPNYGVQLAPEGVTASVTTNSSVFPIGMGETDIVICQFDSSLNLKATTVLSTVKQDNMTKFFVQENGGFIVVGSTLGNLDSPASNSSSNNSVFVIQFEPLVVNSTISAKPMLFSAYESVEIRFSSVPASFASIIPTITFGQKNVTNVYWNNSSLYGQLPPGVGGPYDLWIHFDSPSHFNPKLRIGGYAYELPEIMSISPTTGPSGTFQYHKPFRPLYINV